MPPFGAVGIDDDTAPASLRSDGPKRCLYTADPHLWRPNCSVRMAKDVETDTFKLGPFYQVLKRPLQNIVVI